MIKRSSGATRSDYKLVDGLAKRSVGRRSGGERFAVTLNRRPSVTGGLRMTLSRPLYNFLCLML